MPSEQYVTIVGTSWVLALEPHLNFLAEDREWGASSVQVSSRENGHAAAAILICVGLLESVATWGRFHQPDRAQVPNEPLEYLVHALGPSAPDERELAEVFVVRNVLAHNHAWLMEYVWDQEGGIGPLSSAEHVLGDLTRRYQTVVRLGDRHTQPRKLNVVPTLVGRRDAAAVLETVAATAEAMRKRIAAQGSDWLYMLKYRGRVMRLVDVAADFKKRVSGA